MSGGSDLSSPVPYGGAVGFDDTVPVADVRSPAGDAPGQEFVRPSALAREAILFPDGSDAHDKIDVVAVVDRVTAHLAVIEQP